ncbi:hypothetical protein SDC9_137574 [bioreactor metagenome]|uniref:Uncharacterized protein n=1 Tax=bioreactor metagenome TaxID=1076179 RepID=A0A645DNU8_9ZZZZ
MFIHPELILFIIEEIQSAILSSNPEIVIAISDDLPYRLSTDIIFGIAGFIDIKLLV